AAISARCRGAPALSRRRPELCNGSELQRARAVLRVFPRRRWPRPRREPSDGLDGARRAVPRERRGGTRDGEPADAGSCVLFSARGRLERAAEPALIEEATLTSIDRDTEWLE